jgi:hypothetical protein
MLSTGIKRKSISYIQIALFSAPGILNPLLNFWMDSMKPLITPKN